MDMFLWDDALLFMACYRMMRPPRKTKPFVNWQAALKFLFKRFSDTALLEAMNVTVHLN
jgi:hypothetical protein